MRQAQRGAPTLLVLVLVLAACGPRVEPSGPGTVAAPEAATPEAAASVEPPPDGRRPRVEAPQPEDTPPGEASPGAAASEPSPADASPAGRLVAPTGWSPFAAIGGLVLHHPAAQVELIGLHESNHAGARDLEVLATAIAPVTLPSRDRGTGRRSAADIVVAPDAELRAPVTGTVLRAGTYVLYCDHSDDYVVIAPDARPEWEVKLLHIDGVQVAAGDRVEAGVTTLAPRPTPLPFDSQVDEHTAEPSWPHVHLEVVDPSIPNPPSGDGC